jgi:two-component system, chemotaxis family, sensor kinase CheA
MTDNTKTVFIIDDDPAYSDLIVDKLKKEGLHTIVARSGEEALDVVREGNEDFDLILLDLMMPKMDGITFYYNFAKLYNNEKPVIILTNLSRTAYPADPQIKELITKTNVSLDELMQKIKKYI